MSLFMHLLHALAHMPHAANHSAAKSARRRPLTLGQAIGCLTAVALALCVGVGLLWWLDNLPLNHPIPKEPAPQGNAREQGAINAIWAAGGRVEVDAHDPDKPVTDVELTGMAPSQLDAALGILKQFSKLRKLSVCVTPVTDSRLDALASLETLDSLDLRGTPLPEGAPQRLAPLRNLRYLTLDDCGITDAGLQGLESFPNLNLLTLNRTGVTDAGLEHLEALKELHYLGLCDTQITDAGLERLTQFQNLRYLDILDTKVTREGLERLIKARPDLSVFNEQLFDKEALRKAIKDMTPPPADIKNPLDWLFR
jgi:hypothetical protein